jgi:tetratricopeptide (TPR) repeat protein
MAYRAKGEPDRAIPDSDRAIKLNPNDSIAYHSRGLAYRDIRDYERAIQDFDQAIKLNPEYILALNDRGIASTVDVPMPQPRPLRAPQHRRRLVHCRHFSWR